MLKLDDFKSDQSVGLSDFVGEDAITPKAVSKSSNLNFAAYAASMSGNPEQVVDTYRTINSEFETMGNSPLAEQLTGEVRQRSMAMNKKALVEVLTSPAYTDEQKQAMALRALDENASQYTVRNTLSLEALAAPVRGESYRAEDARIDVGSMLDQINDIKREQQIILNEEMNKENPEMAKATEDLVMYILPFVSGTVGGEVLAELEEGGAGAYTKALTLLGSAKMDIRNILNNTPPEDRLEVTRMVVDLINRSSSIALLDENDYARKDYLQTVLDQGSYDNVDKWVDNVISILDVTGVGGVLGRAAKGTAIGQRASETARRLVKSRVQPVTLSQNYKDTNPDKFKATFDTAMLDDTDEGAQALWGTNKTDVVSDAMMPELKNADGSVMAKVSEPDRNLQLSEAGDIDLLDYASHDGKIYYFQSEKASATANIVGKFEDAVGMSARKEMFQVEETGDGVNIRAVYGPSQTGFASAEDAISVAKWSLRDFGVTEDNIKILLRDGPDYREALPQELGGVVSSRRIELQGQEPSLVTSTDAAGREVVQSDIGSTVTVRRKPRDFLVAVDYKHNIRPGDVTEWAEADVKYNIFDRVGLGVGKYNAGSLQRHLIDAHSMLHPTITKSASAAIDRAAGLEKELLEQAKQFADKFSKADDEIKVTMDKLIREANAEGKDFNYNELVAAGLRDTEIAAMKSWRSYWDNMYHLENADAAKTLRNRGFYEYVDEVSDTRLFAKPVARNNAGSVTKVLDPTSGKVARWSDQEIRELYDRSGTFAKLRRPIMVNDEPIEYIYSANSAGKNYLRAISDDTPVLNYRKGYYSVRYTDPYFVVQRVKDAKGNLLYTKAVATAGSRTDAETMAKAKAAADGQEYFTRQDIKGGNFENDDAWDVFQAGGRSAQRVRGKRLEEPDTLVTDPSQANIMDPVDSMIVAARSAAQRVSMRDMLETTKGRFMKQYEDFLPTGDYGQKVFPSRIEEVMYRGDKAENSKKLGDARTTYEYIRYLENGYINHVDDAYKAALKGIADIAGNAGLDKIDKALRWMGDRRGPSAMGKNLAFNMYLATNPLRQFIVQSHQAVQLVANFPSWVASGRGVPQISVLMSYQLGIRPSKSLLDGAGLTLKQADEMYAQFKRTGQVAAIDKQNLVRGALLDLSDQMTLGKSRVGKAWRVTTSPITFMRRVGFDAGENVNTMSAWLAFRDQAIRAGRDISKTDVQADIAASARNYTYNMNVAGDMPYNQNALAAVFQFMQVPHKAMLGMLTNRVLTPAQKLRLFGFNAVMFTLPPAAMYDWFGDVLPDNPEAREAVVQGLEGYLLNKLLTLSTGEKSTVDWSGLSPMDMYGTFEFLHSLFTESPGAALAATPSGQLLFGNNPRITNFAKTASRYFNVVDDYEDPTTFGQVSLEFARMSSGFSNMFKASYALEYKKKYGIMAPTDSNIPTPNAIAIVFGFQSMQDAQARFVNNELYTKSKDFEEDVRKVYRETKNHLLSKNPGLTSQDLVTRVPAEAWRVFGNDNFRAKQIIAQELKKDLANKDARLYQSLIRSNDIMSGDELSNLINATDFGSEEKKLKAQEVVDFMRRYKED